MRCIKQNVGAIFLDTANLTESNILKNVLSGGIYGGLQEEVVAIRFVGGGGRRSGISLESFSIF